MYKDKIIELCIFHIDEKDNRIENLQAEIKRLKGVLDMDSSLDDAIIKDAELIRELKAENKRIKENELRLYQEHKECRLMSQVSSNSGNSSSTHTHTIKKEIAEYMENNPKCKDAKVFVLPIEAFKGGYLAFDCIDWDDGVEV